MFVICTLIFFNSLLKIIQDEIDTLSEISLDLVKSDFLDAFRVPLK